MTLCAVLLCLAYTAGCDLQNFEPAEELHPPLGLTASSSGGIVSLSFWGLNDQAYFAGYNVFLAQNPANVMEQPHPDNTPYLPMLSFSEARQFTITVSTDHLNNSLIPGSIWHFAVTAYDSFYLTNSPPSEIRQITIE